jgi:hypothetical protein
MYEKDGEVNRKGAETQRRQGEDLPQRHREEKGRRMKAEG